LDGLPGQLPFMLADFIHDPCFQGSVLPTIAPGMARSHNRGAFEPLAYSFKGTNGIPNYHEDKKAYYPLIGKYGDMDKKGHLVTVSISNRRTPVFITKNNRCTRCDMPTGRL
jgi:hypothetical protein